MPIKIAVLKETKPGEKRVSMVPSVVQRLERLGASAVFERGAGTAATFDDGAYSHASFAETPEALVADADIVLAVQPPPAVVAGTMKAGAVLISFVYGQANRELVATLRDKKITAFAMELVPRISRAQSMDALSSQAALAGYYAPLLGAVHMPRILPMMTTAVGSLRAAKVLVMGLASPVSPRWRRRIDLARSVRAMMSARKRPSRRARLARNSSTRASMPGGKVDTREN